MTTYPRKITFGEISEMDVRDVLIYYRDCCCSHHIEINADCGAVGCRTSSRDTTGRLMTEFKTFTQQIGDALPILEQMGYEVTTFKVSWGLPPNLGFV